MPLVVGLVHVVLVAPHYFVGSFDDDASYILTARALVHGQGLTGHVTSGAVVAGMYPPGYPALLAPLAWLWPHSFLPMRLLSVACYVALFPLVWVYLARRQVRPTVRAAALTVLALGPPLATFASMVMAEAPFLVLLMVLLLILDRWETGTRLVGPTGLAVVALAASLVWIKEAGIGVVAGLILWLAFGRGRPTARALKRAGLVAVGVALLLLPVLVARIAAGVPLAGTRYSQELGGYYRGGLADRLLHVVPHGFWQMLWTALPETVLPYGSPLPLSLSWLWTALQVPVALLVVLGGIVWFRRHRDAAVLMVPVYLAMTLLWPYVNERRVILVVPIVVVWFVLGSAAAWGAVRRWAVARGRLGIGRVVAAGVAVATVVVPLVLQAPRDYLFAIGQDSSHFEGSRYAEMLARTTPPGTVVETDYLSSTALFTGHPTAWDAFQVANYACYRPGITVALAADRAGFLLVGALNKPGVLDSPCLASEAGAGSWAVRLLTSARDQASVFELFGPGTGHPGLRDVAAASSPMIRVGAPATTVEWDWGSPAEVTQVSAGEVAFRGSATVSVSLQLHAANGGWRTVAYAASAVGDGAGAAPFLLAAVPPGPTYTGLRLVATSSGGAAGSLDATDVHVLGPSNPGGGG